MVDRKGRQMRATLERASRGMRFVSVITLVLLLGGGCGRYSGEPAGTSSLSPVSSPATPTTASPSSGASPSPITEFLSPHLGYKLVLEAPLRYLQSSGSDAYVVGEDDFSNEQFGAPPLMDANGIFLAIIVSKDTGEQCLQFNIAGAPIDREASLTVDESAASLKVLNLPYSGEPSMVLNSERNGYCYRFTFIALSKTVRDAYEVPALTMLRSFRFGTGPATS